MEKRLNLITYIILICISFVGGFLACDYFSETKTEVIFSGGKLYYNEDGSEKNISSEPIVNNKELETSETAYKINLNTATKDELIDLPSIGEKTAEKIIAYRENMPFKNVVEIMNIDRIGENTFTKIKDYIYVD